MEKEEEIMLEIQNTLVSLDLAEQFFCCDLDSCLGECCIEGDAGAPITEEEKKKIEEILPEIYDELLPAAKREIDSNGVAYIDEEGDLVTSIIDGRNCVFTCYEAGGMCHCAIERAYRQGRIDFCKPVSCHLYPLRLTEYPHIHSRELSPLEDMQVCRIAGAQKRSAAVSVSQRAARAPLWQRMVRRTVRGLRGLSERVW